MEIWIDENGFYAQANTEDFENNKGRRLYKRSLKKVRRTVRKIKNQQYKFRTRISYQNR